MADGEMNTVGAPPGEEGLTREELELERLVPGASQYSAADRQALIIAQGAITGENVPQSLRGIVGEDVSESTNVVPGTAADGLAAQAAKTPDSLPGS